MKYTTYSRQSCSERNTYHQKEQTRKNPVPEKIFIASSSMTVDDCLKLEYVSLKGLRLTLLLIPMFTFLRQQSFFASSLRLPVRFPQPSAEWPRGGRRAWPDPLSPQRRWACRCWRTGAGSRGAGTASTWGRSPKQWRGSSAPGWTSHWCRPPTHPWAGWKAWACLGTFINRLC